MSRILLIGSIPSSLVNFRKNLIEKMVADGHDVFACASDATSEIKETLINLGVTYYNIKIERTGLNPLKDIMTVINLFLLIKEIKPDISFGYTIKPVIYGSFAAKMAGVKYIYSMIEGLGYAFSETGLKPRLIGLIVKSLYRFTLKYNSKVFFLNPDDLKLFKKINIIKDSEQGVLLNGIGVDLDAYSFEPYPDKIVFLLISRLIKLKGIVEYATAAQIVKNKYPEVTFKLIGIMDKSLTGISENDIQCWIESGAIEYYGYMSDVRPVIAESSVFVLPSYYPEGLPRTIMEAMAMGRPVITTDSPGCRETVQEGENGFLVPIKDVPALVKAIEHFITQPGDIERMGLASRRIAEDKFDVHRVNAVIMEALDLV